jgi:hypothetical protein
MSPIRWWAVRAIACFGAVYVLGLAEVPTFIPYVTAWIVVASDLVATVRRSRLQSWTRTRSDRS